jgi:hypothetical protein
VAELEQLGGALAEMAEDESQLSDAERRARIQSQGRSHASRLSRLRSRKREQSTQEWVALRGAWDRHERTNCYTEAACGRWEQPPRSARERAGRPPMPCHLEERRVQPFAKEATARSSAQTLAEGLGIEATRNLTHAACARLCDGRRGCDAFSVRSAVLANTQRPVTCFLRRRVPSIEKCKADETYDTYTRRSRAGGSLVAAR